jgi:hypothetical protein
MCIAHWDVPLGAGPEMTARRFDQRKRGGRLTRSPLFVVKVKAYFVT